MAGDGGGEQEGAVDVDGEQLAETVDGVVDGLEILSETGRGDQTVDFTLLSKDLFNTGLDALRVRDVGVVGSDLGEPLQKAVGQLWGCEGYRILKEEKRKGEPKVW